MSETKLTDAERNIILRDAGNTFFSAPVSSVQQQLVAAVNHACLATEAAVIAKQPPHDEATDKLRAFAQAILKDWPDCIVDGGDIQELAVANGLLAGTMKTEPCREGCNCAEYDFPMLCYTKTELLAPLKHTSAQPAKPP